MTDAQQRAAAKAFAKNWKDRVFIAQYNYQKLQSEMENIASPKWRKLQRIF